MNLVTSIRSKLARAIYPKKPRHRFMRRSGYDSASTGRLFAAWETIPLSSDTVLQQHLRIIRARSRDQVRNNDYLRRYVSMCKANIVGPSGVGLQARIKGLDGMPDVLANETIEHHWKEWGKTGNCEITGKMSWLDIQNLAVSTTATDGEILIRKLHGHGPYGFMLQFLDPELLDTQYNGESTTGNRIRMGVEVDEWERPVAFYLLDDAGDYFHGSHRKHTRVPASELIHDFLHEWPGQKRGIPWTATALDRLKMLDGIEEAELVGARASSAKMGFITSPEGTSAPYDDEQGGELIQEFEPGLIDQLPEGYGFQGFDPNYPNGLFDPFTKRILRGAASGLECNYNTLANDLEGVNYNSLRQGALEDRNNWETKQEWLISSLVSVAYMAWLTPALLSGLLTVPSKTGPQPLNIAREEKYRQVSYQPRRWQWVDPKKQMEAVAIAKEKKWTSDSAIIRDMGADPEDVWRQIKRDEDTKTSIGITETTEGQDGA